MCGERVFFVAELAGSDGSSPRVRGTVLGGLGAIVELRFIPACAGNGSWRWRTRSAPPVHPRVCGERCFVRRTGHSHVGSSPRVRGTGMDRAGAERGRRFIPACAGNGRVAPTRTGATAVHPRVCGERVGLNRINRHRIGSSPRVRGTVLDHGEAVGVVRFIPACAGNGRTQPTRPDDRPVHPRVCGERATRMSAASGTPGSSPRVRGTVCRCCTGPNDYRFIPACAGNGLTVSC